MIFRQHCFGICIVLAWLFSVPATLVTVHAQSQKDSRVRAQAKAAFERGVNLYAAGNYQHALEEFQKAYNLKPHPSVQLNIANCYEQLNQPVEALKLFEGYLNDPDAKDSRDVREAVARLRQRVGEIDIRVTPIGASVRLDGQVISPADLHESVRVAAGTHSIEIAEDGFVTERREVRVAGGGHSRVVVAMRAVGASTGIGIASQVPTGVNIGGAQFGVKSESHNDATESDKGGFKLTTPIAVAGATTIALAVGAVVTGVLAMSAKSDFDTAVSQTQDPSLSTSERLAAKANGVSASDRASTLGIATDIMLGGALVGAAVTTILIINQAGSKERDPSKNSAYSLMPAFHHSGASLMMMTRF